ncbi:MAG: DUF418 domain-containing protein [Pseudomonadota bacterium]
MSTAETADEPADQATGAVVPVKANERIGSLDFIRGIAVMGILAANIIAFGQPFAAYTYPDAFLVDDGDPGGWMWIAQFVVIDGKMRGLFTLLFGAGLILFLEKSEAKGASGWLQPRRLFWLGMFGLFHFFFIWAGDILFLYAAMGLLVLLAARLRPRNLFILGGIGLFLGSLFFAGSLSFSYLAVDTELGEKPVFAEARTQSLAAKNDTLSELEDEKELILSGDYPAFVANSFAENSKLLAFNIFIGLFETAPLMMIGMAFYKIGLFEGRLNQRKQRIWGWVGLVVGGAISLALALFVKEGGFTYFGTKVALMGYSTFPRFIMVFGMAALLGSYGMHARGWLGERVSAAGRAAFTNYLGTSVVMMIVFHGWGLGLFGQLNRPELYLVTLLTCALMLAWSKPWLDRYRYGPLEWLWRCLSYGKLFPNKR